MRLKGILAAVLLGSLLFCSHIARAQSVTGSITVTGSPLALIVPACFSAGFPSSAKQNIAFSCTVSASNGAGGYVFSTVSGSFPAGINPVTSAGHVTGTPTGTTAGTAVVQVIDAAGTTVQKSITITPASLTGTGPCGSALCVTPSGASVLTTQSVSFSAIGYWSDGSTLDLSALSAWSCTTTCGSFSLNVFTAGASAGTATIKATFSGVTDDGGSGISLTVSTAAPAIVTASLPSAQNGQPYPASTCMAASGGTPPYSWQTTAGSLFGVTLNANGCFSGSATSTGSNSVTFKVTDNASNTTSKSLTFASAALSSVTVTPASPTINVGSTQPMQATANYVGGSTANVTQGNTIAPVGSVGCGNASATSTTSITCPPINLPAGVLLIGQMSCSATAGSFAASDTASNTVVFPNSSTVGPTGATYFKSAMFYVLNTVANSADVFTLSNGATGCPYWAGNLAWYSIPSPTLDQHPAGETNASTSLSNQTNSAAITTASANEIIDLCAVDGSTNRTWTAVSPLSLRIAQTGGQSACGDQIVSSVQTAQTYAMQFSGAADNHISQILTFAAGSGSGATWSITLGNCTVTAQGVVTANGGTSCTVQASYGGQTGSQVIAINSPVLQSIAVTPSPASATLGGSPVQMTATGTYSSGSPQNVTAMATWTSSNPAVATVNSSGVVTPVAQGSAIITAAIGSISGTAQVTVAPATTFTTFFKDGFEPNPTSNACALALGPLTGAGDVGSITNINANSNSPADTRSTDRSGHTGVSHTGFCSALDFVGTGNNNFPDLDGILTNGGQTASEVWLRVWVYLSPTWVDCSQASQPCNGGAQHMFRWWAGDGNHPQFTAGLPVQGDVMQGVATCGNATNPYCTAGGLANGQDNILGSFRMSTHAGQQVCWEFHMKANTPGQSNGVLEWFVNGGTTPDGGQYNLNLYGTHAFDGLPEVNMGSNLGGSTGATGYPVNSNYFYVDDVAVTNTRSGCSVP